MAETQVLGLAQQTSASERHTAFAELVLRFQDFAFACAYAELKNFFLAEDAAQSAFITAWLKMDHQLLM